MLKKFLKLYKYYIHDYQRPISNNKKITLDYRTKNTLKQNIKTKYIHDKNLVNFLKFCSNEQDIQIFIIKNGVF